MIAFVTSIGEPTTDLCQWSLKRNGFEVRCTITKSSLAEKLRVIYDVAEEDFVRVDADVIPNKNLTPDFLKMISQDHIWWYQFLTFDWFKQDVAHGGVQFIKAETIPHLRKHIQEAMDKERPETYMSRLKVFHNPRRFESHPVVMGLQNYNNDMERVRATKIRREQQSLYDFELAEKINDS